MIDPRGSGAPGRQPPHVLPVARVSMQSLAATSFTLWVCLLLAGCLGPPVRGSPPSSCAEIDDSIDLSKRIETLNLVSQAFSADCHDTVLKYGEQAQTLYRHKELSITGEMVSVFLTDGTLTEYVLESYERGYLSILLAASYLKTARPEDAAVELRRLDHELFTPLYNHGEDPINLALSAVLWESLGERDDARVDWLRLRDQIGQLNDLDALLQSFAGRQVERIDRGEAVEAAWKLYGVGSFPEVDWAFKLFGSQHGYFAVKPAHPFPRACASQTGVLIPGERWFKKIAVRHHHGYHPLLNIQSWVRLPIGTLYSLVPVTAGAGMLVGGCMADAALLEKQAGQLCAASIYGGLALMRTAPTIFKGTLRPDLRHWERLPSALVITQADDLVSEPCAPALPIRHPLL